MNKTLILLLLCAISYITSASTTDELVGDWEYYNSGIGRTYSSLTVSSDYIGAFTWKQDMFNESFTFNKENITFAQTHILIKLIPRKDYEYHPVKWALLLSKASVGAHWNALLISRPENMEHKGSIPFVLEKVDVPFVEWVSNENTNK